MKLLLILLVMGMTGCSATRVLVKDCYKAGPEVQNCEKIHDMDE